MLAGLGFQEETESIPDGVCEGRTYRGDGQAPCDGKEPLLPALRARGGSAVWGAQGGLEPWRTAACRDRWLGRMQLLPELLN